MSSKQHKIKEIIKQCLREVLVDEGLLSEVLAEGIRKAATTAPEEVLEAKRPQPTSSQKPVTAPSAPQKRKSQEILSGMFKGTPLENVFEGVEPISSAESTPAGAAASVLSGISANDRGINISKIPGSDRWRHLI